MAPKRKRDRSDDWTFDDPVVAKIQRERKLAARERRNVVDGTTIGLVIAVIVVLAILAALQRAGLLHLF